MKLFLNLAVLFLVASCAGTQIKTARLEREYQPTVEPIPEASVISEEESIPKAQLQALNKKAGRPKFAIVRAFYQLPETRTADAVMYREGQFWGTGYESLTVVGRPARPFALTPFDTKNAMAMQQSLTEFLEAGVRFVEISMADTVKIMNSEKNRGNAFSVLPKMLPSGADYLISLQRGTAEGIGSIMAGRVVSTRDGRILAFASVPAMGQWTIKPLLKSLVSDSLRRLAAEK